MAELSICKLSWREQILKEFSPECARLTLVSDPDSLLVEEKLSLELEKRGFDIVEFEDSIMFRYIYESKYRSIWDEGGQTNCLVVIGKQLSFFEMVPYDVYKVGRKLSFSLSELFPNLNYSVISELDRAYLDPLYEAQTKFGLGPHSSGLNNMLGENETKDFILRHVFGIVVELVKEPPDLLRILLRRHYQGQHIPPTLDTYFIHELKKNEAFSDWPLDEIVPRREAFFEFLQERWPIFLDRLILEQDNTIRQNTFAHYTLEYKGPEDLPFDHEDIRVYVDNLFIEGFLLPVKYDRADKLVGSWVHVGIKSYRPNDRTGFLEKLFKVVESTIPSSKAAYNDWLRFARKWGELISLTESEDLGRPEWCEEKLGLLKEKVDSTLVSWSMQHYSSLINLPATFPVMVHHVSRFLSRSIEADKKSRVALLVVDGLSFDQWILMGKILKKQEPKLQFSERTVFAWIPTVTSVSRQAIFAGRPPFYFPVAINSNSKESQLWVQFWITHGLNQNQIAFTNILGDESHIQQIEEILEDNRIRVFGVVVRKVDKIMHGMELGTAGMHNQIAQWTKKGFMKALLDILHKKGFQVYLTSDHGNIEAIGMGSPREGAVADLRGERVRIYSNLSLRSEVKKKFPDAIEWPAVGLPEGYFPLLAPNRHAFVTKNERIVGHGGITVEELLVPFVEVQWRC